MQRPTLEQLKRALHIGEAIEKLQAEMSSIFGEKIPAAAKATGNKILKLTGLGPKKKRTISASHRAAIVKAQKARWAKTKGKKVVAEMKPAKKRKKGKMSAAGRAAIVAAQKLRWSKVKKAKAAKPKAKKRGRKTAPVVPMPLLIN